MRSHGSSVERMQIYMLKLLLSPAGCGGGRPRGEQLLARVLQQQLRVPDVVLQLIFTLRLRTIAGFVLWLCACPIAARCPAIRSTFFRFFMTVPPAYGPLPINVSSLAYSTKEKKTLSLLGWRHWMYMYMRKVKQNEGCMCRLHVGPLYVLGSIVAVIYINLGTRKGGRALRLLRF